MQVGIRPSKNTFSPKQNAPPISVLPFFGVDHQGRDDVAQGDRSEDQGGIQYHNDDADKALGRLKRGGPARVDHFLKISQRAAMRRGKTGAGWPAFIWNAGIMSSRPATIDTPGAIATKASRSMTMPKERLRRPG
jgi:hypothetical protein